MIKKLIKGAKAAKKFSERNKGKDFKDLDKKSKVAAVIAGGLGNKEKRAANTKKMTDAMTSSVSDSEYRTSVNKLKDNREKNAKAYRKQN